MVWGTVWSIAWTVGWYRAARLTLSMYGGFIGALGIGICGWFVLRQHRQRAYVWVLASLGNWYLLRASMDILLWTVISKLTDVGTFPRSYLWLALGMGNGLITGGILAWLLNQPQKIPDLESANIVSNSYNLRR